MQPIKFYLLYVTPLSSSAFINNRASCHFLNPFGDSLTRSSRAQLQKMLRSVTVTTLIFFNSTFNYVTYTDFKTVNIMLWKSTFIFFTSNYQFIYFIYYANFECEQLHLGKQWHGKQSFSVVVWRVHASATTVHIGSCFRDHDSMIRWHVNNCT